MRLSDILAWVNLATLLTVSGGAKADALAGIAHVFDRPSEMANAESLIVVLDTEHPDVVREKLAQKGVEFYKGRVLKRRVVALTETPCVLVHYAEIDWEQLQQPNVKAIVFMARKIMMNRELDAKLFAFLRENEKPMIGFCGSHQMIAQAFGGKIDKMRRLEPNETDPNPAYYPGFLKEWGFTEVTPSAPDPIFAGLKNPIVVNEMHAWEIVDLPEPFEILASTSKCKIQMIRHRERLMYGTQFHAEAYDDAHQDGKVLLVNFFHLAGIPPKGDRSSTPKAAVE